MSKYNLPINTDDTEVSIMVEAALDWVDANTTLNINREAELPSTVKLFVIKYCDLMAMSVGVASESLGGMSQSFSTSNGISALLSDLAEELFGAAYKKKRNRFVSAVNRWKQ